MTPERFAELYNDARTHYHEFTTDAGYLKVMDIAAAAKARNQFNETLDVLLIECGQTEAGIIVEADRLNWPELDTLLQPASG